jgi:Zn-dependent protease with chaperone function
VESATPPKNGDATQSAPAKRITDYTLPPELYRKAHTRGRISFATRIVGLFWGITALWVVLWTELSAKYRDWAESTSRWRFVQAFMFTAPLVLTIAVLQLPVELFREVMLKHYGISVQSWLSWFGDWGIEQCLTIIIGGLLAWLLFAMIRKSPRRWWFYFWLASLPIILFFAFVSPYVIDPLFNKYEPLASKAPQLVPELQKVTRRAGMEVPPERMFWMKASDKTVGTNASVNGFGASKRIIIWDTTLQQETTDEVLMDFGHEMGHYVLGHIWRGLLFAAPLLLVLFYAVFRSIQGLLARYGANWKVRAVDDWAALTALLLLLTVWGFAAEIAGNAFSRHLEHEADVFSMEVTHGLLANPGQAAAHSFQLYGETVLDDPDPDPTRVFLFYDHPPTRDRIRFFATYDPWSYGEQPQFVR